MTGFEWVLRYPKADPHTHFPLAGRFPAFTTDIGPVPVPPVRATMAELERYITTHLTPYLRNVANFERALALGFMAAAQDNVRSIAATVSLAHVKKYGSSVRNLTQRISEIALAAAPGCRLRLYAGIRREYGAARFEPVVESLTPADGMDGIDLTGDETSADPAAFRVVFETARANGLRLRAHCGEYGGADDVLRTVETLGLHAVQHGMSAADSRAVLAALAGAGVVLNLAPASSRVLMADPELVDGRIVTLLESGVRVTIGTDDLMLFHQTISDQVIDLLRRNVIAPAEARALLGAAVSSW